jgi:hypothetical protein
VPEVCRTCKDPIRWARTIRGYAIPLDPEPRAGGNLEVDDAGTATIVPKDQRDGRELYVQKLVTCPLGAEHCPHRRPGR